MPRLPRAMEAELPRLDVAVEMLRRACSYNALRAQCVPFTNPMQAARSIAILLLRRL